MLDLNKKFSEYSDNAPKDTLGSIGGNMGESTLDSASSDASQLFVEPSSEKGNDLGNRKGKNKFASAIKNLKKDNKDNSKGNPKQEENRKEIITKLIFVAIVGLLVGLYAFQPIMTIINYDVVSTLNPFLLIFNYLTKNPTFFFFVAVLDIFVILAMYKMLRDKKKEEDDGYDISNNNTFGKAHKSTKEELEGVLLFEEKTDPQGFVLGLSRDTDEVVTTPYGTKDKDTYNTKRSGNVMVFGASGSGKTFCFVKPNVLARIANKQSYVVTDPSGELYRDTSMLAKSEGYDVKVLNLLDFASSDGWNPFACFDRNDSNSLTDLTTLCGSIMKNTSDAKSSGDYFYNNEENLLKCLSFYVALSPEFKGAEYERNLATVYDMIVQIAAQGNQFPELDSLLVDHPRDAACSPWALFSSESDNIKKNFVSGLNSRLNKFENPNFKEIFRHNDIDMSMAGKKPCAYYVIFDEKNDTYKFVLNMFFSSFITALFNEAKNNPNKTGKLDIPVFFILDEAASIGQLPDFIKVLNNSRKYGMSFSYITQSYGFLQSVFGTRDNAMAIWSACDNTLAIGTNDTDTAKELSLRSGEATVTTQSEKRNEAAYYKQPTGGMHQIGISDSKRQLMTVNEVMTEESAVIFPRQRNMYVADKYAFLNHKFADFTEKEENKELAKDHIPNWHNKTDREYHYGLVAIAKDSKDKLNQRINDNNNNNNDNKNYADEKPVTRRNGGQ